MVREKEINQALRLFAASSVIVLIGIVISKIATYAYRIIIARYYGPAEYGIFSLAIVIAGWFIAVASLGWNEGAIRFMSLFRGKGANEKIKALFRINLSLFIIMGLIASIILFFSSHLIATELFDNARLENYLKFFSLSIILIMASYPPICALRSFEFIKQYSVLNQIIPNVAKPILLVVLIYAGIEKYGVQISYVLSFAIVLAFSYILCKNKVPLVFGKPRIDKKEKIKIARQVNAYSMPLLFFGVISAIFYWVDSFLIGYLKGVTEVGYYNGAIPIATLLVIAPELFVQLFFPLITKEYAKNRMSTIKELSKQIAKWIFIINLPLFILLFLFPGFIINLFFGEEFLQAVSALRILSIGTLVSSASIISVQLISISGRSKLTLANTALALIVNIALNFVFIPMGKILWMDNSNGLAGAALATLISLTIFNLLFIFQTRHYLGVIPLRTKMLSVFAAAIAPTLMVIILRKYIETTMASVILVAIIFMALYALSLFLLRCFDRYDLMIMRSAKEKIKREVKFK